MLKVHYDLLHEIAVHLDLGMFTLDPAVNHMEDDPDAYLASMLDLVNKALIAKEGGRPLRTIIDPADSTDNMKKMRRVLDREPAEHVPEHVT